MPSVVCATLGLGHAMFQCLLIRKMVHVSSYCCQLPDLFDAPFAHLLQSNPQTKVALELMSSKQSNVEDLI